MSTRKKVELTPGPEARVLIAKDVLRQIKTKRINPRFGAYIYFSHDSSDELSKLRDLADRKPDARSTTKLKSCEVCAVGSVFVAVVNRVDGLTNKELLDHYYNDGVSAWGKYLSKWFSMPQLRLMEVVFEGSDIRGNLADRQRNKASEFRRKIIGERNIDEVPASEILIAIMNNIIENSGEFKV